MTMATAHAGRDRRPTAAAVVFAAAIVVNKRVVNKQLAFFWKKAGEEDDKIQLVQEHTCEPRAPATMYASSVTCFADETKLQCTQHT